MVRLIKTDNQFETEMIKDILQQNDITVLVKDIGAGGYLKIYMGFSVYGNELYVKASDYDQAKELLEALHTCDEQALWAESIASAETAQQPPEEEDDNNHSLMTILNHYGYLFWLMILIPSLIIYCLSLFYS